MSETPDPIAVALLRRFYECYGAGDHDTIRREIFAPDIVWTLPGRHPLSGPKHGVDQILAYFEQAGRAHIQAEVLFLGGDDTQVVDVHRGWASTEGADMDMLFVLHCRVAEGRIVEATAFAADQAQCDAFFWAAFPLAPIPQRLAETSPRSAET